MKTLNYQKIKSSINFKNNEYIAPGYWGYIEADKGLINKDTISKTASKLFEASSDILGPLQDNTTPDKFFNQFEELDVSYKLVTDVLIYQVIINCETLEELSDTINNIFIYTTIDSIETFWDAIDDVSKKNHWKLNSSTENAICEDWRARKVLTFVDIDSTKVVSKDEYESQYE